MDLCSLLKVNTYNEVMTQGNIHVIQSRWQTLFSFKGLALQVIQFLLIHFCLIHFHHITFILHAATLAWTSFSIPVLRLPQTRVQAACSHETNEAMASNAFLITLESWISPPVSSPISPLPCMKYWGLGYWMSKVWHYYHECTSSCSTATKNLFNHPLRATQKPFPLHALLISWSEKPHRQTM